MKFLLKRRVQKDDKQNSRENLFSQGSTSGSNILTKAGSLPDSTSHNHLLSDPPLQHRSTSDLNLSSSVFDSTPHASPFTRPTPVASTATSGIQSFSHHPAASSSRTHSPPLSSMSRRSRSPVKFSPSNSPSISRPSSHPSSRIESDPSLGSSTTPQVSMTSTLTHSPSRSSIIEPPSPRLDSSIEENNVFIDLALLRETPPSEQQALFRRKLQACINVYDFTRNVQLKAKEAKRQTLLELVEYVNSTRSCFPEPIMGTLVQMVASNIFRTLPPPTSAAVVAGAAYDPEDDEPTLESAWPHLQIVYEFFLRFVVSTEVDPKAAKRYIDQQFVLKLLDLFSSEDPRERDYLKTILHRIYGKIMALRSFIRKAIQHVFFRFIYEQEGHKGISELLEILGSIINGFALPLKEEHKTFLEKSLIPLHKARSLSAFNQQLTYCMTQYVEKDSRLAEPVIMGLLRFWPVTNTNKEVVFLNELEEILELTQPCEFQRVMCPLFKRLSLCIESPHFQVAERVLFLWNNEYIVTLFNNHKQQLFPLVISALYKNSNEHWNSTVHGLTYNVSKLLAEADPKLFDDCSDRNMNIERERGRDLEEREERWKQIERSVVTSK